MGNLPITINLGTIESLAVDIQRDPNFHAHGLQTMDPAIRHFLETRAQQLVESSDSPVGACLALVVEVGSLFERQTFDDQWQPRVGTFGSGATDLDHWLQGGGNTDA